MPSARAAPKRKRSALASGSPTSAPLSTARMQQVQAADDNSDVKVWTPALHLGKLPRQGGVPRKYSVEIPYAVLILNQPINDVELFVTVCRKGKPGGYLASRQQDAANSERSFLHRRCRWRSQSVERSGT
jgi:hypothetical protein